MFIYYNFCKFNVFEYFKQFIYILMFILFYFDIYYTLIFLCQLYWRKLF